MAFSLDYKLYLDFKRSHFCDSSDLDGILFAEMLCLFARVCVLALFDFNPSVCSVSVACIFLCRYAFGT